jgi:LPS export ABC transporter protein LptC
MKRLKFNRWFIGTITLLLVFLVFSPEEKSVNIRVETRIPNSDYFLQDVSIYQFDPTGRQANKLSAVRLEHSSQYDLSILDKPVLSFTKHAPGVWQLASKFGELTDNNRLMKLVGLVEIDERPEGKMVQTKIITRDLLLDLEKNTASTDASVFIKGLKYKTSATGLNIQFKKELFELSKNVTTEIYQ